MLNAEKSDYVKKENLATLKKMVTALMGKIATCQLAGEPYKDSVGDLSRINDSIEYMIATEDEK